MMWQLLVIMVVLLGIWARWRYKNRRIIMMARQLPGPPPLPVIGNALIFMVKPRVFIKVIRNLLDVYGDVIKIWLGTDLNIFVSNPEDVKIILTHNKASMKGPQYKYMADVLGGGILSGSGTPWRKHRKIAAPNYGKRAIESYNDIINDEVQILLQKFKEIANGQQIDIYQNIVQTTSYIVCQTLIGLTKKETMELPYLQKLIDITPELYDIVFCRMTQWYLQINPVFWLTKYHKLQNEGMRIIREVSTAILKHRMKKLKNIEESAKELLYTKEDSKNSTQISVIDRFILSQALDSTELINETFTIFTSSQEATAKISSFLLLMMAYHPMMQEKLHNEIVRVIGEKERPISEEDFKQMPYLEMTFKEVIRLFPIAGMMQRTTTEDIAINILKKKTYIRKDLKQMPYLEMTFKEIIRLFPIAGMMQRTTTEDIAIKKDLKQMPYLEMAFKEVVRLFPIAGMMQRTTTEDIAIISYTIPAGASVVIPTYHMHRDPRYWIDPDAFNPERFNLENTKSRNPYIYIPFSLGSMDCLGRHFATKTVKTIVVRVMQNFKLVTYKRYKDLKVIISISTMSMDGFPVILIPRSK